MCCAQSCLTLCNPMDRSLPASSVHSPPGSRVRHFSAATCKPQQQPILTNHFSAATELFSALGHKDYGTGSSEAPEMTPNSFKGTESFCVLHFFDYRKKPSFSLCDLL